MKNKISFTYFTPANFVTYIGMILTILSYYFVFTSLPFLALPTYTVAALTDALDGFVAKNPLIQKLFGGRGKSEWGATIDPVRDFMLKFSVFVLAISSGISIFFALGVALIPVINLLTINNPLNKLAIAQNPTGPKVIVLQTGRLLHIFDCIIIGVWFLVWSLEKIYLTSNYVFLTGIIILFSLIISNLIRTYIYRKEYHKRKRTVSKNKSIF